MVIGRAPRTLREPHVEIEDGDLVLVRGLIDSLDHAACWGNLSIEQFTDTENRDTGLAKVKHSPNLRIGQHIREIEGGRRHDHHNDGLLRDVGHLLDEHFLGLGQGDGIGIVALFCGIQVRANGEHHRVGAPCNLRSLRDARPILRLRVGDTKDRHRFDFTTIGHSIDERPKLAATNIHWTVISGIAPRQVCVRPDDSHQTRCATIQWKRSELVLQECCTLTRAIMRKSDRIIAANIKK